MNDGQTASSTIKFKTAKIQMWGNFYSFWTNSLNEGHDFGINAGLVNLHVITQMASKWLNSQANTCTLVAIYLNVSVKKYSEEARERSSCNWVYIKNDFLYLMMIYAQLERIPQMFTLNDGGRHTMIEWCACCSLTTISNSRKEAPLLQKYTSKLLLYNGGNCSLDKSQRKVSILSIKGVVITVERGNYRI